MSSSNPNEILACMEPGQTQSVNLPDADLSALGLKLSSGLSFFRPSTRSAILINSYDEVNRADKSLVCGGYTRGSRRIYDMEALLTGKVNFAPDYVQDMQIPPSFLPVYQEQYAWAKTVFRPDYPYSVHRCQSYHSADSNSVFGAIEAASLNAASDSLTPSLFDSTW